VKELLDLLDDGWAVTFKPEDSFIRVFIRQDKNGQRYENHTALPPYPPRTNSERELRWELERLHHGGEELMQRDEMKVVEHGDDLCGVRPINEPGPHQGT
jgi:hypothetical protein